MLSDCPQSISWGNPLDTSVNMAQKVFPDIIGDEHVWYPLQRMNLVPGCLFKMQATPAQQHLEMTSAVDPFEVVTGSGEAGIFRNVINRMRYGTNYKLVNLSDPETVNLTNEDLNTSIDKPESRWHVQLVLYNTITFRVKPSSNSQSLHCSWSFWIYNDSCRFKQKYCDGWQIAMHARNFQASSHSNTRIPFTL